MHCFSSSAIKNNLKSGGFTSTGSEFLTLTPVIHRYLSQVARPRETEHTAVIDSMLACLSVIMMLQACRTGIVQPADLLAAVVLHLSLCLSAYGEEFFRPKHHYSLHLAGMLERFGYLLSTFVHERKHRLVTRYTRDRRNLVAFDAGALEEITCHQLWELKQPFLFASQTATPTRKLRMVITDLFPDVGGDSLLLLSGISVNGGRASAGDVVTFLENDVVHVGELLMSVGVKTSNSCFSFIAKWQFERAQDAIWSTFKVSDEDVCKVNSDCLDTVLLHRKAADNKSCAVYFPFELRPAV